MPHVKWARWSLGLGVLLMVFSGGTLVTVDRLVSRYENAVQKADLFGDEAVAAGAPVAASKSTIKGPVNVLLAGIDTRNHDPLWIPRADSVLVLHIPAGMDRAYLFSLPRDLLVQIPPFAKAAYPGSLQEKLAHAMFFGSRVPGSDRPSVAQGFELLAKTVSAYTGITRFDAGAIIDFSGFKHVIDALGGVEIYVDQEVKSIHLAPDGSRRPSGAKGGGYEGPQATYLKGTQTLVGWQALDYARQRYTEGGDYARQRHQQQLVQAIAGKAFSADILTNPVVLDQVLRAAGKSLTFSGRGHSLIDWALAMREMTPESLTMVKLIGGGVMAKKKYLGEQLYADSAAFFAAVVAEQADAFVLAHPEMINASH